MMGLRYIVIQIIKIIENIISFILALRIIFKFFAVNPATPAVLFINNLSNTLTYPFRGIVSDFYIRNLGPIDTVGLISLIFYWLVFQIILMVVQEIFQVLETHIYHRTHHKFLFFG